MGVYDELRNSINISAGIVNNYDFSKAPEDIKATLNSMFDSVKTQRKALAKNVGTLNDIRGTIFSTLMSVAAAQYYYNNISVELNNIKGIDSALRALTNTDSTSGNFSVNAILTNLKAALSIKNVDEVKKYASQLQTIFSTVKQGFGYEEADNNGNVDNELYMDFHIEKTELDTYDKDSVKKFSSIDKIDYLIDDGSLFSLNDNPDVIYALNHKLRYKNESSENDKAVLTYSLTAPTPKNTISMNIAFDPSNSSKAYISKRATAKLKISQNLSLDSKLFGEEGTYAKPYVINDVNDVRELKKEKLKNNTDSGVYIVITSDLDFSGCDGLTFPLGTYYGKCSIKNARDTDGNEISLLQDLFDIDTYIGEDKTDINKRISPNIQIVDSNDEPTDFGSSSDTGEYYKLISSIFVGSGEYTLDFTNAVSTATAITKYESTDVSSLPSSVTSITLEIGPNLTDSSTTKLTFVTSSSISIEYQVNLTQQFMLSNIDTKYAVVSYLADLVRLVNYNTEKNSNAENIQFMSPENYISIIVLLENALKTIRTDIINTVNDAYDIIKNNATSYITIEGTCEANGPIYSSDYITDLESNFNEIISNITTVSVVDSTNSSNGSSSGGSGESSSSSTKISITMPSVSVVGGNGDEGGGTYTPGGIDISGGSSSGGGATRSTPPELIARLHKFLT